MTTIKRFSLKPRVFTLFFLFLFFFLPAIVSYAWTQNPNTAFTIGDNDKGINQVLNIAVGFFMSGYMRAICTIALGGLGVGMLMNRGEPGMVKKFIPWIVAVSLILSLSAIVDLMGFAKV